MLADRVLKIPVFVLAAVWLAAAGAQTFDLRTLDGNGRNVFELRLGGTNLTTPDAQPNQGLILAAVTSGPSSGTTSLIAAVFDGKTLFDPTAVMPAFATVVASGSVFSLGGGCQRDTQTVFPFINNSRPQLLRYSGGTFSVGTPTIANTDQYDSADCAPSLDRLTNYFIFTNRTRSTLEVYKDNASGFLALPTTSTVSNVGTPFSGGIRPAVDLEPLGPSEILRLVYGINSGSTTTVTTSELNVPTATHINPCPLVAKPRPTGFTRPRESAVFQMEDSLGGRVIAISDFDNNGSVDIVSATYGCQITTTQAGSSNGGGAFNWTAYAGAVDNRSGSLHTLWGDYFYVDNRANYAITAASPGPFPGRGGPFAACPANDLESGAETISLASGTNQAQFQIARGHRDPDKIFQSSMSRRELMNMCIRAFLE